MAKIDYPMVVVPLDRDNGGGYAAYAIDLPGCMADGETPSEALEELQQAIGEWVEEAKRLGRDIPAPGSNAERAMREKHVLRKLIAQQSELLGELDLSLQAQKMDLDYLKDRVEAIEARVQELAEHLHDEEQGPLAAMTISRLRTGYLLAQ